MELRGGIPPEKPKILVMAEGARGGIDQKHTTQESKIHTAEKRGTERPGPNLGRISLMEREATQQGKKGKEREKGLGRSSGGMLIHKIVGPKGPRGEKLEERIL